MEGHRRGRRGRSVHGQLELIAKLRPRTQARNCLDVETTSHPPFPALPNPDSAPSNPSSTPQASQAVENGLRAGLTSSSRPEFKFNPRRNEPGFGMGLGMEQEGSRMRDRPADGAGRSWELGRDWGWSRRELGISWHPLGSRSSTRQGQTNVP